MARSARAQRDADAELVRCLVATWEHETVYALLQAAEGWAGTLRQMDRSFPDPDKRATAIRLDGAAALLRRANGARDWLEGRDKS